ncbi:DNA-directed RNA polymerase core subunit rpc40 [Pleurotus pulmonarius]|nr:DNA-directed RNA polymerase core subunit rpc40 [Pleurotus pulmonarius]KAF4578780.1 DNA-directed RNA polymerase core subunit rpc40 [Pleurotus pulmonarius]
MQVDEEARRLVHIGTERVSNVSSTDFPGHAPDEDQSWDLERFKNKLSVKIQRLSNRSIEFDLVRVDASIANALRRIMIAEVPTICIEHVYIWDNTSVIADEVLSHRIGLVPLNVDPAVMDVRQGNDATDRNTMVFKLDVTCQRRPDAPKYDGKGEPPKDSELYINHEVLSKDLVWQPQGEQVNVFIDNPPAATNSNIVLAKLRPGQSIKIEMHAVKGLGGDHAKFSPVATASYRILPSIKLNPEKPIPPHLVPKFQQCFAPGVIHVDPVTKAVSVADPRKDTVSREVLRHPEFAGCVELGRVRDHFIFNVESEGPYVPERLLPEALSVLRTKIATLRQAAELLLNGGEVSDTEMDVS